MICGVLKAESLVLKGYAYVLENAGTKFGSMIIINNVNVISLQEISFPLSGNFVLVNGKFLAICMFIAFSGVFASKLNYVLHGWGNHSTMDTKSSSRNVLHACDLAEHHFVRYCLLWPLSDLRLSNLSGRFSRVSYNNFIRLTLKKTVENVPNYSYF